MLDEEDIKQLIIEELYNNNLIDYELYIKCGKPHISSLPYDLRTNDVDKLEELMLN